MESTLSLTNLATVLYRPRETMRRVLDAGDRWVLQIVIFAFVCGSVSDTDFRRLPMVFPGLPMLSVLGAALLGLVVGALLWLLLLVLLSWIVTPIGRMLGGSGATADVRAALAWGLVPVIWSVGYRIPLAIYKSRIEGVPNADPKQVLLNVLAHGGCAIAVVVLVLQLAVYGWCLYVASNTLGEAERFSSWKGLATLAITFTIPLAITLAAVFAFRS